MKFAASIIACLAGLASAGRIPMHQNQLTIADYMAQKERIVRRAYRVTQGEELPMKDYMNTQYFINIKLGSDNQEFTVVPDTGSSNLWVYSMNCSSIACRTHEQYDPSTSSTYESDGQSFDITYGSGSVNGYVSSDVCTVGDDIATRMSFGEIQSVKGSTFLISQMDGIIGLAFDTISVDGLPTFMDNVSSLPEKTFSFYMHNNPSPSYMVMPGIDESLGLEQVAVHDVIEETYWNVNMVSMSGPNGTIDTTGYKAAIDSGTSLIMGPNTLLEPLLEGIVVEDDCSNLDSLPDLTFTFDSVDYLLTPQDYVLVEQIGSGDAQCIMGIMGADLPADFNYMIVGDVFMRPYPTKFDLDNKTVTFYKA